MNSKLATDERQHFSNRLKDQLRKAGIPPRASVVAAEFNLRAGGASVTAYAVRKWLIGDAIPTHERMLILANWLGVHASWLQYGDPDNGAFNLQRESMPKTELMLISDYRKLPPSGQKIVREMLTVLLSVLPRHDSLRSRDE